MDGAKTFYDILGVAQDSTMGAITKAFRDLVREHHPDRFTDPQAKREAETQLKEITEAYNMLSKPHLRSQYDESLRQPDTPVVQKPLHEQVKELLLQAKVRARSNDLLGALACFDHILRLDAENAEALFGAGMIRLKNPHWRAQGGVQVEKAIERDPFSTQYVAAYASFLMDNNQMLRAQRLLETALENHPADAKLQGLLEQARGGAGKSGGVSLFGKK